MLRNWMPLSVLAFAVSHPFHALSSCEREVSQWFTRDITSTVKWQHLEEAFFEQLTGGASLWNGPLAEEIDHVQAALGAPQVWELNFEPVADKRRLLAIQVLQPGKELLRVPIYTGFGKLDVQAFLVREGEAVGRTVEWFGRRPGWRNGLNGPWDPKRVKAETHQLVGEGDFFWVSLVGIKIPVGAYMIGILRGRVRAFFIHNR